MEFAISKNLYFASPLVFLAIFCYNFENMKTSIITLIFSLLCGLLSAQQDTCVKSIALDAVYVTAEKISVYRDYKYVTVDFEIADDKFFILQRRSNSQKNFRILVTNLVFEPLDTINIPEILKPTSLEFDIADNVQIVTQDSLYQIVNIENKHYYAFPVEKNHYREVMSRCLFMTDRYIYFCDTRAEGYLLNFYRISPQKKERELLFCNNDLQKYSEIPQEVQWHVAHSSRSGGLWFGPNDDDWRSFLKNIWMRPEQAYLGHSHDTLYYFDHQNRRIETFDEDLNQLHSCDISYPEKETFWRHTIYQDRAWGTFYTIFGTTLNEIDIKTGKTIPKINANNYLSLKMIIYKGNLYSLKKRRDSGNTEISFIEKTKLY